MPTEQPGDAHASCLLETEALALLLQHPSICGQLMPVLCRLLCTSKGMRAAIAECCVARIPVSEELFDDNPVGPLCTWLAQQGHLLRSLEHPTSILGVDRHITKALAAAASSPHGLHLLSYSNTAAGASTADVMKQLPPNSLQNLDLQFDKSFPYAPGVSQALGSLTALRTLSLKDSADPVFAGPLLLAVSGLTQLTSLTLRCKLRSYDTLKKLPPQLVELHLMVTTHDEAGYEPPDQERPPIELSSLTALQTLNCGSLFEVMCGRNLQVWPDDVLPPYLHQLNIGICRSANPLTPLRNLRSLSMFDTPADQLRIIASTLTVLTALRLYYSSSEPVEEAVALAAGPQRGAATAGPEAAPRLPLVSLELNLNGQGFNASGEFLRHLSQLQALTYLGFYGAPALQCDVTPSRIAAVLSNLSGLQGLRLGDLKLQWEPGAAAAAAAVSDLDESDEEQEQDFEGNVIMDEAAGPAGAAGGLAAKRQLLPVFEALAALPVLSSLHLTMPVGAAAARRLAAATQLTSLGLQGCQLTDSVCIALASGLSGLRKLDVSRNTKLTDAAVPAIVQQLQQLTELRVRLTGVSAAGRAGLQSGLTQLKQLDNLKLPVKTPKLAWMDPWALALYQKYGVHMVPPP